MRNLNLFLFLLITTMAIGNTEPSLGNSPFNQDRPSYFFPGNCSKGSVLSTSCRLGTRCDVKSNALNNEYLFNYPTYQNPRIIYLENTQRNKFYYSNVNQDLWIVNYPVFVYGKMQIFKNRDLILEEYCSGDDYFDIKKGTLETGTYLVLLTEDDTMKKYKIHLKIVA